MKHTVRFFTTLVLLLCSLFAMTGQGAGASLCHAAGETVVTAETLTAVPGETVACRVSIAGNPGLISYHFRLRFDTSVFSLVYDEEAEEILCEKGDFSSRGTLICAGTDDGCQVLWTHTADVTADGGLFTLYLRVKDDAALGEYPVQISNITRNTVNKDEERVPVSCKNGAITVRQFQPTVSGGRLSAKQGETFDYVVSLRDNPGIASYGVQVIFDSKVLSLAEEEGKPAVERCESTFAGGSFVSKTYSNAAEVFWYAAEDTGAEGDLFVLHFRVKEDAALGETPITVVCVADNIQNTAGQRVSFTAESGAVEVLTNIEVSIQFVGTDKVSVTTVNTEGRIVVAAVYTPDGQLIAVTLKQNVSSETFTLTSPKDLSGAVSRVMVLDTGYVPVCPVFSSGG